MCPRLMLKKNVKTMKVFNFISNRFTDFQSVAKVAFRAPYLNEFILKITVTGVKFIYIAGLKWIIIGPFKVSDDLKVFIFVASLYVRFFNVQISSSCHYSASCLSSALQLYFPG